MRNFKRNTLPLSMALLGITVAASPLRAQENLSAPPGWKKSVVGSDTIFLSRGQSGSYTVKKLMPRTASFQAWFESQVRQDSLRRGTLVSSKVLPPDGGIFCIARNFRTRTGQQSLFYVGYPVGDLGRLTIFSAPNERVLSQHVRSLKGLGTQVAALDRDIRLQRTPVESTSRASNPSSPLKHNPRDIPIAKPPRL